MELVWMTMAVLKGFCATKRVERGSFHMPVSSRVVLSRCVCSAHGVDDTEPESLFGLQIVMIALFSTRAGDFGPMCLCATFKAVPY